MAKVAVHCDTLLIELIPLQYNKLTADQLHTARMIGITESLAVRIVMGKTLTVGREQKVTIHF